MSANPASGAERKRYSTPVVRSYGSIVATTRGSVGNKTDGGTKKAG